MKNKVVVITGASSGIGEALAHKYALEKSKIVISGRNEEKLSAFCNVLRGKYNAEVVYTICDVAKKVDCEALIRLAIEKFGCLDLLVCNAGISMRAPILEVKTEVLEELMQINFWGAVYCIQAALPYLIQSQGVIVGVSSIAGYRGLPERAGYTASKFALNGFLESLRTELIPTGVHVLTAAPGFTATNIRFSARSANGAIHAETPMDESKIMSADDVALHIYDAVKKRKRSIILTMQGKMTVWINKFFPAMMDGIVYRHFFEREKRVGELYNAKKRGGHNIAYLALTSFNLYFPDSET